MQIIVVAIIIVVIGGVVYAKKSGVFNHFSEVETAVTEGKFKYEVDGDAIPYDELFKDKLPVIAVYGTEGCPACKQFEPVAMKINKEFEGKAYIKYVDVWKHQGATGNIPVRVIPTQVFFDKDGKAFNPTAEEVKRFGLVTYKNNDGKLMYTTHEGILSYDDMVAILESMGVKK